MMDVSKITRGDDEPDIVLNIGDSRATADFSTLTASAVRILGEMNGILVVDDVADSVVPAQDGKSAIVRRAWAAGETETAGVMWFTVRVEWTSGRTQTFPRDGAIPLHILRAAGDP